MITVKYIYLYFTVIVISGHVKKPKTEQAVATSCKDHFSIIDFFTIDYQLNRFLFFRSILIKIDQKI